MTRKPPSVYRNLEDYAGIASDWFWETDEHHRFTYFSSRMEEVTKIAANTIIGTRRDQMEGARGRDAHWQSHLADLHAHRPFRNFEYAIDRPTDGSRMWLRIAGQPQFSADGSFTGYRGTGHDITQEKIAMQRLVETNAALADRNSELYEARAALERAAYQDALTGLWNRRAFERDIKQALTFPDQPVGLLHVDLDRFKLVNDSLGHQVGDAVLIEAAHRIRSVIHGKGQAFRTGGDEFLVLLIDNVTKDLCNWIGDNIIELMNQPVRFDQKIAHVGASIGLAVGTTRTSVADDLISLADAALYEAKRSGRNVVREITDEMQEVLRQHRRIAADIPLGLNNNAFIPHFQPQVDAASGEIVGVEALARWQHPKDGILSPNMFLDAAADLGVVNAIDRAIMREALAATVRLKNRGCPLPAISVNISAGRLMDPDLVTDIETYWVDRSCTLCIELLETIYYDEVRENAVVNANLTRLRDMGVRVETDDFGSGRASITGLLSVHPDRLKIDRALIQAAIKQPIQRNVVAAICDMAKGMGIAVLAEGVETQADIDAIRALGCDVFQGYAFSRPLSEAGLLEYLKARQTSAKTKTAGPKGLPKRA